MARFRQRRLAVTAIRDLLRRPLRVGPVRWPLLVGVGAALGSCDTGTPPESLEEGPLPLLQSDDLRYVGAFRLPATGFGVSDLNFAEGPIHVSGSSLLIVGHAHHQAIAEFVIPPLVNSPRLADLALADPPRQEFATVLDRVGANPQGLDRIGSIWRSAADAEVWLGAYEYYDAPADNTHNALVIRDGAQLAASRVDGFYALGGGAHVGGWMTPVPERWQQALGGAMLAGASSGIPIIGRASVGPSAFAFDPAELNRPPGPVETVPLLDYSLAQPLEADLSNASGTNRIWTHLSRAVFGAIVPGSRTYLVLGQSGGHGSNGVCYKCTPIGAAAPCGGYCAVDPADRSPFLWLYDVDDFVRVRSGELEPWQVRPYAYGPLDLPFEPDRLGGASYDADAGLLWVNLVGADREQGPYANPPVVAALRIDR